MRKSSPEKPELVEITPANYMCGMTAACPGIFDTGNDTLLVVGKIVPSERRSLLPEGRVADDELVVEIPRGMIAELNLSGKR